MSKFIAILKQKIKKIEKAGKWQRASKYTVAKIEVTNERRDFKNEVAQKKQKQKKNAKRQQQQKKNDKLS